MISSKKSILFICPAFFGYEISIKDALELNGYNVDFFDERSSNHSFYKAIFRVAKNIVNKTIDKYYNQIFKKIEGKKYDYFFLIKGEIVPEWFIENFKTLNPKAKLIYYTYDSFNNNNRHSLYILKHFDDCYTFDFEDAKSNPTLKLKHLFYTADYLPQTDWQQKKFSVSFIGTLHSNRYSVVKKIANQFNDAFIFYYMPAKWFYLLSKVFKKEYRAVLKEEVNFKKMTRNQVADIFKASKSVIDIQRYGQTGLTMRTFEVLASGSILVTTNPYIKDADLYDDSKIVVLKDIYDLENGRIIKEKISNPLNYTEPLTKNFEKYFINNWVKEFFE